MPVDTSAAVEQLLKRFEALRGCGIIELLAIKAEAGSRPPTELPPRYKRFTSSRLRLDPLFWQFRLLGGQEAVTLFCHAAKAAAEMLAVPMAEAGFIRLASCRATHKDAGLCSWLEAMLAAGAAGNLATDGIEGGGWRVWSPGTGFMCDEATLSYYSGMEHGEEATADPVKLLVSQVNTSARYAVFENVVETSIAFLQCLDAAGKQQRRERRDDKPKKPFHNLVECIEDILSSNGGKERLLGCSTAEEACKYIQSEYPGQPASPSGLGDAWHKGRELGKGFPAWPWKKKKRNRRTVVEASRLGEHVDLDGLEARSPARSPLKLAPQRLKCAACDDDILPGEHMQIAGKVYCLECGSEKRGGITPSQ